MRLPFPAIAAAVVAVMPIGAALGQTQNYQLNFTSSGTAQLAGGFTWSGTLPANGTYAFAVGGAPIVSTSIKLNQTPNTSTLSGSLAMPGLMTPLTGTFQMTAATPGSGPPNDGTYAFESNGSPAVDPSFTAQGTTFTNLPNQSDSYLVAAGVVAALEYDLAADGKTLGLALDGSYVVQLGSTILESGSYSMAYAGFEVYTLIGNNSVSTAAFTNLPNQNDSYTVTGDKLARLKYDLYGDGYNLMLKLDGTYELLNGFTVVDTGTYSLVAVPEPTSAAIAAVGMACALGQRLRRRRSAPVT